MTDIPVTGVTTQEDMMFESVVVPKSEYDKLIIELESLRRQRNNADTLRLQRDEALHVLRQLATLADGGVTIKESAQVAWDLAVVARGILAQYTEGTP